MRAAKILALSVVVTVAMLNVNTAQGHVLAHMDADDSTSDLDMRRVEIERTGRSFDLTINTHNRFTQRDLYNSGYTLSIDSRGDRSRDFYVTLGLYENSYPYCNVYNDEGFSRAGTEADKGPRSISCSFERDVFRPTKPLRWNVRAKENTTLVDRSPDKGRFQH